MPIFNPTPPSDFLTSLFKSLSSNDGNVHITVNTTLTADMFAITLTVDAGVELKTNNYRIYCLTHINNFGIISNDGNDGADGTAVAGGAGGVVTSSHSLRPGRAGANGVINGLPGIAGDIVTISIANPGSEGGGAGAFAGGAAGVHDNPSLNLDFFTEFYRPFSIQDAINGAVLDLYPSSGSGSGAADAGAAGSGGAGAGGGIVFIVAASLNNQGTIRANGGAAGNPFDDGATSVGGSGGGAGGLVIIYTNVITKGTIQTNGASGSGELRTADAGAGGLVGFQFISYNF